MIRCLLRRALHRQGAVHGIDDACELDDGAIADQFHDPAVVGGDRRVEDGFPMPLQGGRCRSASAVQSKCLPAQRPCRNRPSPCSVCRLLVSSSRTARAKECESDQPVRRVPSEKFGLTGRRQPANSDHVYKGGDQDDASGEHQYFVNFEARNETPASHGYPQSSTRHVAGA